ncbi:glycosyltransferase [Sphingobium sp. B2]|uniref:glycosyltransferase n=1 Tax=Sphingobium sp. B2 TaxID=2583228 RepID=UPI0011A994A0|nr:glycosyltransferase [Sphingobium sp. B2]
MIRRQPVIALLLPYPLNPLVGGVQRITWQLGQYFAGRGWKVIYVSLATAGHCQPPQGVLEHPAEVLPERSGPIRAFLNGVLTRHQPDVVINQMALSGAIGKALWEASDAGCQFIVVGCFHNSPALYRDSLEHILGHRLRKSPLLRQLVDNPAGRGLLLWLHRRRAGHRFCQAISQCHRLVLLSPTFFEEIRWFVPDADPNRLAAIANGFPTQPPPSQDTKRNRLLFVGRMNNLQKNIFMLPDLWERLHAQLPDWELHLVGDGRDLVELKAMVAARRLPRVMFHGRTDPTDLYCSARLFLMVSAFEGFGNTLIEAQMQGTVPVAFDTYSALRWILHDGIDALILRAGDIAGFAEAISRLARDSTRLASMSEAAVANAKRFSETNIGGQWEMLLAQLGVRLPQQDFV